MCNEINLEELEALANAAGGVKWIACGPSYGEAKPAFLDEVNVDDDEYPEAVCQYPAGCRSDVSDKMAYIAEANPATLLSLLDRLKSAEAERDALAAMLSELEGRDWHDPVAYIDNGTGRPHWCPGAIPNSLPHGTKLYARPVPAVQSQDAIDAKRYRALRRGQAWSVIDGIGDDLRGEALDAAIDASEALQIQPQAKGD